MYQVGKEVEVIDYDTNIDEVCSKGIHYFKSLECAQMWELDISAVGYTGPFKKWYNNGNKRVESNYVNGKRHGPFVGWYTNGNKREESNYVNGKLQMYVVFN